MQNYRVVPAVPAAVLAQRVLDVCITNDDAAIDIELNRVLYRTGRSTTALETTGLESERQELVRAIAMSMNRRRETRDGVAQEARFGVWVDLLRHLSAGEPAALSPTPTRES